MTYAAYAVLDYILYGTAKHKLNTKYAVAITNGAKFSDDQQELLYQANLAFNDRYYKSDAPENYVYSATPGKFKPDSAQAKDYQLQAAVLQNGDGDGILIMNGGHQKPEVDHIVLRNHQTKPGSLRLPESSLAVLFGRQAPYPYKGE